VQDPQTRRVFEVATHKVEYVDSLCAVRQRHRENRDRVVGELRQVLLQSAEAQGVRLALPAVIAAQGLHALIDGIIQNWLLDPEGFDLEAAGSKTIDAYLHGVGLQ
jgi:TetR/AcrR family transcriptional regulator, acrAB operon repressor